MNETSSGAGPPADFDADVSLAQFERSVHARTHEDAARLMVALLQGLRRGASFSDEHLSEEARIRRYTRLAAAITALLADPGFKVSQHLFDLVALDYSTLRTIFSASGFANSDHLTGLLGTRDAGDARRINFPDPHSIAKLLLCYSLDSELELDLDGIARMAPRSALPSYLGMLSDGVVLSPAAHRRREKLLTLGPLIEQADLDENMLLTLSAAYMMSSYATAENKHVIKRSLNRLMRRMIENRCPLPAMPAARAIKPRPTILVPIEWFNSPHTMYRCYASSIRQLRERFRLAIIGHEMCMDDGTKALFDETVALPNRQVRIAEVIAHVRRIAPDVIFYPSVGMILECVALSSVRLAPIQVATLGHPATTNSEAMDYMLLDGMWPSAPGCFSETVIVQRPGSTAFTMYADAKFPEPRIREAPAPLRIAVPSSILKLNAPFLAACQAILQETRRPVEFHFFPSVRNLVWFHLRREIHKWIPDAIVHSQCHYNEYLRKLAQCDVHLSTFPFGGTNTNIDSMLLALPMVTLQGTEPHSQFDAAMMRRAGIPEWLIAGNPSEYEQAALRLIDNDAERLAIARQLARTDIKALFTKPDPRVPENEFLRVITFLYEHHESIQATGRRYWNPSDRDEFLARRGAAAAHD